MIVLNLDGIGRKSIKVTRFGGERSSIWEFVRKRIFRIRQVEVSYVNNKFNNKLMYEIYKSVAPSMKLYPNV